MWNAVQVSLRCLPILLWTSTIQGQTCMVLSRPVLTPSGTMTFDLSLRSAPGGKPAALQWSFQFSSSNIAALTVEDGPALAPSRKSTFCAGNPGSFNCLAAGRNSAPIGDGIVAKVTATLAPGSDSANLAIASPWGASPAGFFILVIAKSSTDVNPNCGPEPRRRREVGK